MMCDSEILSHVELFEHVFWILEVVFACLLH